MKTTCFIHYTPLSRWCYDHLCWIDLYNWALYSIPKLLWLSLIMTFMYSCKEFTGKNLFRIIILIWKLHVSSITQPFRADVTIICVDLIWIIECFIPSQFLSNLLWLSLIMTFMYSCKEFTAKNLFRIIILIWKLHVSSITHPFRADVTIICVDLICIIERFIQSQICYDYHWSWHLCIVVRNSLVKICFV